MQSQSNVIRRCFEFLENSRIFISRTREIPRLERNSKISYLLSTSPASSDLSPFIHPIKQKRVTKQKPPSLQEPVFSYFLIPARSNHFFFAKADRRFIIGCTQDLNENTGRRGGGGKPGFSRKSFDFERRHAILWKRVRRVWNRN